jgi:hypothetical protein
MAQTGDYVDGKMPPPDAKPQDIHCSMLVGVRMTNQKDGSYFAEVYQEVAPTNEETKYLNIDAMARDGVAPVETFRLSGHSYTHTVHGIVLEGKF